MRVVLVCLVFVMLIGVSTAMAQSQSELLDEIEEHVIDPCIRISFDLKQGEDTEQEMLRAAKEMEADTMNAIRADLLPVMQQVPSKDERIKRYAELVSFNCLPPE